jgi:hypothetical protein
MIVALPEIESNHEPVLPPDVQAEPLYDGFCLAIDLDDFREERKRANPSLAGADPAPQP